MVIFYDFLRDNLQLQGISVQFATLDSQSHPHDPIRTKIPMKKKQFYLFVRSMLVKQFQQKLG